MKNVVKTAINVLFVGSFKSIDGKIGGGQMYASTTLVNSEFNVPVNWIKLDTTASTNLPRPLLHRLYLAGLRIINFVSCLLFKRVDIVLIFTTYGFGFVEKGLMVLIARLLGKPVVLAPRSGIIIDDVQRSKLMKLIVKYVMTLCSKIICQSNQWKEFYERLIGGKSKQKMVVIPNWLDASPYEKIPVPRSSRDNTEVKIMFIGWVDKNKGVFDILDAMRELNDLKVKLIIGGTGAADEEFDQCVKEYGLENRVARRGWVSGNDKILLLSEADIFVMPSYREGMPNALLEAMASGLPVIASQVGGIPDVIHQGETGFLINPGDSLSLANNIRLLAGDKELRARVGENARAKIIHDHSLEKSTEKIEQMFSDLVG